MVESVGNGPDQKDGGPQIEHDFDKFFPLTIDLINNFEARTGFDQVVQQTKQAKTDKEFHRIKSGFYGTNCYAAFDTVDKEIFNVIGEPWNELKKIHDGFVAVHTMLVLWRTVIDPLYSTYSKFEQNIVKWAALLHDIRKLGMPVYEGKDHIHPFKSA